MTEARRFLEVTRAAWDKGYHNQAVSNAAHAVIAANDAVCLFLGSRRPGGKSHAEAAQSLQDACRGTRWEKEALQRARQLTDVIQRKNEAEYYGKPMDRETAERLLKQAQRFLEWVREVLELG